MVVLLDQLTKIMIMQMFTYGQSKPVTSFFNLVLAYNKGAAFSFLASRGRLAALPVFRASRVGAAIFIIYLLQAPCRPAPVLLGAGADAGRRDRQPDRPHRLRPRDRLPRFPLSPAGTGPAFNVADSAICIGAVLFIIDELRRVNR